MIAVDAQLLVYAHRRDSPFHEVAARRMAELCAGPVRFALPMQVLAEFYAVVTHARVYRPPSTPAEAVRQMDAWTRSPAAIVIYESDGSRSAWTAMLVSANVQGAMVHDARLAATCAAEGVSELWTADRDLGRFPAVRTRNPLV